MGASRAYVTLDFRGRVALGRYARGHTEFLLTVDEQGVIRLAPAEVNELPKPLPVRKRTARPRKRTPAAAEEKPEMKEA